MLRSATVGTFLAMLLFIAGCGDTGDGSGEAPKEGAPSEGAAATTTETGGTAPSFSLAASEYPSWSTFMVASKLGLINGEKGKQGSLEKKNNVDIVLEVKEYDPCITLYGNGSVDAACLTQMDTLNPALTRPTTIIAATSTSSGGDQVIAVGAETTDDLKGQTVYGLKKSVSEYTFRRGLEKQGKDPSEFDFQNLDPGPAATALQQGTGKVKAICVWNPFALTVTTQNKNAKVVFSSELIKGEILDCVVVANSSIKKEGGDRFCKCVLEAFYEVARQLDDPSTSKTVTTALGEDFSDLNYEQMKTVLTQTLLYKTPQDGVKLFKSAELKTTMAQVLKTCTELEIITKEKTPTIGYGDSSKQLNFDPKFMEALAN